MDEDGDRVAVSAYVPPYQLEQWAEEAEKLGMSRSEFLMAMVQAGRHDFDFGGNGDGRDAGEPPDQDGTPGGNVLKTRIKGILRDQGPLEWDDLLEVIAAGTDEAIQELQDDDVVRHSGERGGYFIAEDSDGD